jgi:hypothetical protein
LENLYVSIPKDIDEYEKKLYMGITARQLVWIVIASIVSLFIFFLCSLVHLYDLGFILCFVCGLAIFSIGGFRKWHGRPYDEFLKSVFRYYRRTQRITFCKPIIMRGGDEHDRTKKSRTDRKLNKQYANEQTAWDE